MAYSLSFSPEFFLAEGEPYDRDGLALNDNGKPVSVWSAICLLKQDPEAWRNMCKDCFPLNDPKYIEPEAVLNMVEETNTCGELSSPVDVWIDPEGFYTLDIYE